MIKSYTNGEWKEPGSLCQAVGIYKEDFHKIVSVSYTHLDVYKRQVQTKQQ